MCCPGGTLEARKWRRRGKAVRPAHHGRKLVGASARQARYLDPSAPLGRCSGHHRLGAARDELVHRRIERSRMDGDSIG